VTAALLFISAGTVRWPQAWIYLAEIGVLGLVSGFAIGKRDPALLRERMAAPIQKGQKSWDKIVILVLFSLWMSQYVVIGLDAMRWNPWRYLAGQSHLFAAARDALALVGLGDSAERTVAETSYGERRRLEMAMALAQKPKVLLLDEPLAGLSQQERQQVRDLLAKVPRDVTIVMIEHDMDSALAFAERITLLHYGEVIVEGTRAEVVADPRTKEVYLGE